MPWGLRRDGTLSPAERDRVEMTPLSASGWSGPKSASRVAVCQATVYRLSHRFRREGPNSLCCLRRYRRSPSPEGSR